MISKSLLKNHTLVYFILCYSALGQFIRLGSPPHSISVIFLIVIDKIRNNEKKTSFCIIKLIFVIIIMNFIFNYKSIRICHHLLRLCLHTFGIHSHSCYHKLIHCNTGPGGQGVCTIPSQAPEEYVAPGQVPPSQCLPMASECTSSLQCCSGLVCDTMNGYRMCVDTNVIGGGIF